MEGTGTTARHAMLGAAYTSWKPLPGTLHSHAMINGRLSSDVLEESLLLPTVITSKAERQKQGFQKMSIRRVC